jgi:hypothetical protein
VRQLPTRTGGFSRGGSFQYFQGRQYEIAAPTISSAVSNAASPHHRPFPAGGSTGGVLGRQLEFAIEDDQTGQNLGLC